jgi:hypothetical protein
MPDACYFQGAGDGPIQMNARKMNPRNITMANEKLGAQG